MKNYLIGIFLICFFHLRAYGTEGWASGINSLWHIRKDYGEKEFYRFAPEIFAHTYFSLGSQFYLRPGARLSYVWQQPEMPKALKVEEKDIFGAFESALLYEWYVIPSLALGGGFDWRTITLKSSLPIVSTSSSISHSEQLLFGYIQIGLGVPLWEGRLVIEPVARFHRIDGDSRSSMAFGFETSIGWK